MYKLQLKIEFKKLDSRKMNKLTEYAKTCKTRKFNVSKQSNRKITKLNK